MKKQKALNYRAPERRSVTLTDEIDATLRGFLLRADGQEDICIAAYSPSTGATRRSAILREVVLPEHGEREVHGNATVTGEYVLRAAVQAAKGGYGIALLHSHPRARGWQSMSRLDRDAESSYANLVREVTGLPMIGMTLAGGDLSWSARHWDDGVGSDVCPTESENVRVISDRLRTSWNDRLKPPPPQRLSHVRSMNCWGPEMHADLTRRSVLVVGLGSVGLDVAVRLAAAGVTSIGLMDFDTVKEHNLDRLIGARRIDAALRRSKLAVAYRLTRANATAAQPHIALFNLSICEPAGLAAALDYDQIICCVDRPWPRAVLNATAYRDLIPVIDGGVALDAFPDGKGMRNATWRSHVVRPGRPCMACNGQLDLGAVAADRSGALEDPAYIAGDPIADPGIGSANVALISINAAANILAQYVSFNVAPGGVGEPGPLQYLLSTHTLEHLPAASRPTCPVEALTGLGDGGMRLTGVHLAAEVERRNRGPKNLSRRGRILRRLDDLMEAVHRWLTALATESPRST
jgi:molybdopterin-synthase adenylyltransferase